MNDNIDTTDLLTQVEKLEAGYQELKRQLEELKKEILADTKGKRKKRTRGYKGRGFGKRYFSFCLVYEAKLFKPEQIMKIAGIKRATYFRYQKLWKTQDADAVHAIRKYTSENRTILFDLYNHPEHNVIVNIETFNYYTRYLVTEKGEQDEPVRPNERLIRNPYYRDGYSIFKTMSKTEI